MMHIARPSACGRCGLPLFTHVEALEPLSGLLISELWCLNGHGYIGSRWPAGAAPRVDDDDTEASE